MRSTCPTCAVRAHKYLARGTVKTPQVHRPADTVTQYSSFISQRREFSLHRSWQADTARTISLPRQSLLRCRSSSTTTPNHQPQSETASSTATPRKPSPYRLLPPHLFLSQFAPLHVEGWRLDSLPAINIDNKSSAIEGDNGVSGHDIASHSNSAQATLKGAHGAYPQSPQSGIREGGVSETTADLQDRRLVRLFEFSRNQEGWRDLGSFISRVSEVVEEEDVSDASSD
jgi:hypothetical protein